MRKNKQPTNTRRTREPEQPKASVFSYYANRPAAEPVGTKRSVLSRSPATTSGKRLPIWQLLPSLLALLAILLSLGYSLTLSTSPRLSQRTLKANSLLQPDDVYQSALEDMLKQSIFNRSKLLINAPALEDKLQEKFPELASATITIPLASRRPILSVEPIVPALIIMTSTGKYVLDNSGHAVLESTDGRAEALADLPVVRDDSGLEVKMGQTVLPKADTQFVKEFLRQLKEKNIFADEVTLPAAANELHVHITGEGYYIKCNTQGDARIQAGTYLAVRDKLARDGKKPAEYIDVRVDEKAFYK